MSADPLLANADWHDQDMTLAEAKDWLRLRLDTGGAGCPCCSQFAKIYRRKITSTSVRGLAAIWSTARTDFAHIGTVMNRQQADETKLAYWGLLEEERRLREDGGRAGFWRITPKGIEWLFARITLPKYAYVYNGAVLRLDGDPVTVIDALGTKFNYRELMADL